MSVKKLNALYLATIPFLSIYALPNGLQLNWVLVVLLFVLNISVVLKKQVLKIRKNEIAWFVGIMVIGFLGAVYNNVSNSFFDITLFFHNLFAIVLFFIALIVFIGNSNVYLLKKYLYIFGGIAASICIYQRVLFLITGSFPVDVFIPGLIVNRDLETFAVNRVSSFFTEPAHLAIYLLPIYYMSLYEKKYIITLLCGIGIISSGSSTGFILFFVLTIIYMQKSNAAKKYKFIFMLGGILAIALINIYFPDVLLDNIEKINNADSNSMRLLGPLEYIQYMDIGQIMIGVGYNQLSDFLRYNGVFVLNDFGEEMNGNYANAFIYSFLSYGIVGFFTCLIYFYRTIKINKSDLGFIVFSIGILLSDQVLFNRNLLYITYFLIFSQWIIPNKAINKKCML